MPQSKAGRIGTEVSKPGTSVQAWATPPELVGVNQEVRKHVATIHIAADLGLLERKLVDVLLLNAYENLTTQRRHSIPTKLLMAFIGFDSKDTTVLKNALKKVASTLAEFNLMDVENAKANRWSVTSLLADADIVNGYCEYEYSTRLVKELSNPDVYAIINVAIQRRFGSSYGLALYQNCLRYRNVGSTGVIPLERLRKLIGATAETYSDFRRFNELVLKKAIAEVNAVSDIVLQKPLLVREGRKVVGVKFAVEVNPQQHMFDGDAEKKMADAKETETYARMRALGISDLLAVTMVIDDEEKAKKALDFVEQGVRNKTIRRPAGYLRKLLDDPDVTFGPSPLELEVEAQRKQSQAAAAEAAAKEQNRLLTADARTERIKALIRELTPHELRTITAEYVAGDGAKNASSYNPATGKFMKLHERVAFQTWLNFYIARKHGLRPDEAGTTDQLSFPASPDSSSEAAC